MIISGDHSRRTFLKELAVTGAVLMGRTELFAAARVQIDRIDVTPLVYPMRGRFKFFEDPSGRMQGRAAAVIKITADDGTEGWGESVPIPRWSYETLETVVSTVRRYFTPVLLGRDPFDMAGAHQAMDRAIAPGFDTGQPMARAGIDIALHDLCGKCAGKSIPEMWGMRSKESILLSWTLNPKTASDIDPLIEAGWKKGFRHFNVKVAPDPELDLVLCRRVKAAVPRGFLWADANGGYDLDTALFVAPKLADAGVDVLEQPIRINNISGYQALKRQGALPIFLDEGVISPKTLEEFIKLDMLDGVAMKPARCGGLLPGKRQIEILKKAGLSFLGSGLTDPDISLAATLQLYGAFGYAKPAALNGPQFIDKSLLETPLEPEHGCLKVPTGPGLGIDVDESKIRALAVEL